MKTYSNLKEIREIFNNSPVIKNLVSKKAEATRKMNFTKAIEIQSIIEGTWEEFLKNFQSASVSVIDTILKMSEEDKERNLINLFSVVMLADCFDFMLADIKESFKKYEKGGVLSQFDGLNKASKEAAAQIRFLLDQNGYDFSEEFADNSDSLRESIMENVKNGIYVSQLAKINKHEREDERAVC